MRLLKVVMVSVALAALASTALSQSPAPTTNILTSVLMVQSQYGRGTIFSVDVDNREYWITAKHVLTGAKHPPYGSIQSKEVILKILNPGGSGEQWLPEKFSVIDTGDNVDIVVLVAAKPLLPNRLSSEPLDSAGQPFGGECEFLGFPFGGSWRARWESNQLSWMPFTKHCTVSAFYNTDIKVWVLDGINNEGFSGGPVIWGAGSQQKIMAVISGYWLEPADVVSSMNGHGSGDQRTLTSSKGKRQYVNVNSGFIVAYDVSYVLDAIRKHPIGPSVAEPKKH